MKRKIKKQKDITELFLLLCGEFDIEVEFIQPYHIRLTKDRIRVDVFPQSDKFHNINKDVWGVYGDVESFLGENFNIT